MRRGHLWMWHAAKRRLAALLGHLWLPAGDWGCHDSPRAVPLQCMQHLGSVSVGVAKLAASAANQHNLCHL